jgi:hypothetical protein
MPLPTADDQRFPVWKSADRQAGAWLGLPRLLCVPDDKKRESGHDFLPNMFWWAFTRVRDNPILARFRVVKNNSGYSRELRRQRL